jgi:hypothetical protein
MGKKLYDKYKRWVPPPPNPPPMTDEENKIAIATHMANPPLCYCCVPAQIHQMMEGDPYTPEFECRNRTKDTKIVVVGLNLWHELLSRSANFDMCLVQGGYRLCHFNEYDYGFKSY